MDEFEQSASEKDPNEFFDTFYQNEIHYEEKEIFFIKNYKCSLFSLLIVIKQKGRITEILLGPVHMIPGQLIAPGQLTDPGVIFASVHGLTPGSSLPRCTV